MTTQLQQSDTPLPVLRGAGRLHGFTEAQRARPPKEIIRQEGMYELVEAFYSVQGEGLNTGVPMLFVRFSKCNLACDFCDTPYNQVNFTLSEDALLQMIKDRDPAWVMFTGGEPCLQLTVSLVQRVKALGILTGIETNGMIWNEALKELDYITISPKVTSAKPTDIIPEGKRFAPELVKWANHDLSACGPLIDEARFIICGAEDDILPLPFPVSAMCISPIIRDPREKDLSSWRSGEGHPGYGSPDPVALKRALELVHAHRNNGARLSLQTHKLLNVR